MSMDGESRREKLLQLLNSSEKRLTGAELAKKFQVSRQVIVQDIAILRAAGQGIVSTPQGYMMLPSGKKNWVQRIVSCHHRGEDIKEELGIVLDKGGRVLDVIVEHPIYGDLRGSLMMDSRRDLELFLEKVQKTEAQPLSSLTGGSHLHTLEAPDETTMEKIEEALEQAGFLEKPDSLE